MQKSCTLELSVPDLTDTLQRQAVRRQNQESGRLRFPVTTFKGWALAGECSVGWLPSGATRSFESGIAMRTWLFVALKVNGRVQFFRQQLTQAAAA